MPNATISKPDSFDWELQTHDQRSQRTAASLAAADQSAASVAVPELSRDHIQLMLQTRAVCQSRPAAYLPLLTKAILSPDELKGKGLSVRFGSAPSPFGYCEYAESQHGLCHFRFRTIGYEFLQSQLARTWPEAVFTRDDRRAEDLVETAFATPESPPCRYIGPDLWVPGTDFQMQVWKALIQIPPGALITYQSLAVRINRPKAQRAVGSAVGANPVALFIPCHRVIHATGPIRSYRWGTARKRSLVYRERLRCPMP